MAKSLIIFSVALIALLQLAACEEAAIESDAANKNGAPMEADKQAPLVPVVLVRGSEDKPDFFLVWWKPYEQFIPKPMMDMIDSQVRPQTQQISGQIISNVPGAEQVWSQMSQVQNIIDQLGVANVAGGSGSGSSSGSGGGLSSLMSQLSGRARR